MNPKECAAKELARIKRVADMLCTGHAEFRDMYAWRALMLDIFTLAVSTWLVALAFVEPRINVSLTPFGWDSQIWIGALGTGVFFLTLIQIKTDWKGRADAHKRTMDIYAEVKQDVGALLTSGDFQHDAIQRVYSRYEMASAIGVPIPEAKFLYIKKRHLVKVSISKQLDTRPGASIAWLRVCLWWQDNFKAGR